MKNNTNPEYVFNTLVQHSKHKKDKVFANELTQFIRSEKDSYYFLSEDYYEHHLKYDDSGKLFLTVASEKEDILARTGKANESLARMYANN